MERGNAKHSPREDDMLAAELAGTLGGPGGSNREEWVDPEPPADDDPPQRVDAPHDLDVANDWHEARGDD